MLFLWVRFYNIFDWVKNFFFYYVFHPKLFLVDSLVLLLYFFKSPYRIARKLYPSSGPYGETPFSVMDKIIEGSGVLARDFSAGRIKKVLELGCGRGRLSFWFYLVKGSNVEAVDINRLFIKRAQKIAHMCSVPVHFRKYSCFDQSLSFTADLVYCYILHFSHEELDLLAQRLVQSKTSGYIITISFWFGEIKPQRFELIDTVDIDFVWGSTQAYVQKVLP